jgi:signal transduction histidine kinase
LTFQLSPPVLHDLGLTAAVEWLGDDIVRVYDLPVHVDDDGSVRELDERTRVILFRAVRELLVNVGKHAGARSARVRLRRRGQVVKIVVEDDGAGFDPEVATAGHFGLSSIRERLSHLGGTMSTRSKPGEGTRVELAAPLGGPSKDREMRRQDDDADSAR